jgi:hypothetical protein
MSRVAEAVRFQRDLYLYWHEVQMAEGLPLTRQGFLPRPSLRRIAGRLAGADGVTLEALEGTESKEPRLFYLRRLLERLHLLEATPEGTRLAAAPPTEIKRYLAYSLSERLRICLRVWVAGGWWQDRLRPQVPPSRVMAPAPPRLALSRRQLLERLHNGALEAAGIDEVWQAALSGPLSWMGLVNARLDPGGKSLGWEATGIPDAEPPALEAHGRVILQPNFEVLALPPLTAPVLRLLDSCAEEIGLDRTARYRLTRQAFTSVARRHNWQVAALIEELEAVTAEPLPENVRITMGDWERHAERLRLTHDVRLLEVREAHLLDALAADRSMAATIEKRITSVTAILAPDALPRVRAWLLRNGELPAIRHIRASEPSPHPLSPDEHTS